MGRTSDAKKNLLEVATTLIWEQSYNAVSVDQICARADVNKGSFYHFFPSKSDLAVAALEAHWQRNQPLYDNIFSTQVPPLERLKKYCDAALKMQKELKSKCGKVLGCPYASVGSELSTQDDKVRDKITDMFARSSKYLEVALRDAHRDGLIPRQDFPQKADVLFSFLLGNLLQARIKNDLDVLKDLYPSMARLIEVQRTSKVSRSV